MGMEELTCTPDWRDGASYAPLLRLDKGGIAWELLRRNPRYRCEAAAGQPAVEQVTQRWRRIAPASPNPGSWGLALLRIA